MADLYSIPEMPSVIGDLARRCHALGGRAYLVGGSVRDHLLGAPVKDYDVEVYGLSPRRLVGELRALGHVNQVGRAFGVFKLTWSGHEIDVSMPRRDSNAGPGHRGIRVEGDPDMAPEEGVRRRDLTINAIMLDVLTGELLDPSGGQGDLRDRRLRAVDATTFLDDPLRALRVVQFAGRFGFQLDPTLVELCRAAALDELPAERIQGEWFKALLRAPRPSVSLAAARETATLGRVFPEVEDHPELDRVLDTLAHGSGWPPVAPEGRRYALFLGGWLHRTPAAGAVATLDRLWLHKWQGYPLRDRLLQALAHLDAPIGSDAALRNLSTRCELDLTLRLRAAITSDSAVRSAWDRSVTLGILHAKPKPLLLGRATTHLVPPGPRLGRVLEHVYQLQLDGQVGDEDAALAAARAWLHHHPG